MLLAGMAGGMAWGIRGQYGHETGAMIAGTLVGLVIVFLFCPKLNALQSARAVALMALGVSFGGSMTYGQTLGLTHDGPLIGNTDALAWGLLGVFIKGGIWIGLAALFLGLGLSRKRYGAWELTAVVCGAVLLLLGGIALLNQPFDPANRALPRIYFSDHWRWEPDSELKPRFEKWGGLLLALVGLWLYATLVKRDRLVRQLTLWGFVAGGLGFAGGQSLQAAHAWHPEWFDHGTLHTSLTQYLNWWNLMETTFGFVFGAILALGVWRHRDHLIGAPNHEESEIPPPDVSLSLPVEIVLLVLHVSAVITWNFFSVDALDAFADLAIPMGILPMLGIMAGRWWPFLFPLPIVTLPIAGKTVRELSINTETIPLLAGLCVYLLMPLYIIGAVAIYFGRRPQANGTAFARNSLLLMAWMFFYLNLAFFRYPWPWEPWTGRTPHGLSFFICAVGLSLAALCFHRSSAPDRGAPRATILDDGKSEPAVPWKKLKDGD